MGVHVVATVPPWEIAGQFADSPADLADMLTELSVSACNPVALGRDCAHLVSGDAGCDIAAWLRAFADGLDPKDGEAT